MSRNSLCTQPLSFPLCLLFERRADLFSAPHRMHRNVVSPSPSPDTESFTSSLLTTLLDSTTDAEATPVKIGRSHVAMWIRIVSSWVCLVLYAWSLVAPVVMPERFGE